MLDKEIFSINKHLTSGRGGRLNPNEQLMCYHSVGNVTTLTVYPYTCITHINPFFPK